MTVVVGLDPLAPSHGALDLAVGVVRTLPEPSGPWTLVVATVVPPAWGASSGRRTELERLARERVEELEHDVREHLAGWADELVVEIVHRRGRSVSRELAQLAQERDAAALVVGSARDARRGTTSVGSTADYLLHSSPVPVTVAPRGYRIEHVASTDVPTRRLTAAYSGVTADAPAVRWAADVTREIEVGLRVASFGVRAGDMYPPEAGLDIEAQVDEQWTQQMATAQRALRTALDLPADVETVVASGPSWEASLAAVEWLPGEVLVVGSSTGGTLRRVFLGARAAKILRHAPVPVLVVPRPAAR
ncbi:universal stress protein [Cellulomonas massiliensis]|uniref:universal stress protein n=1 Tax=Cellulomonas massiliensis TaxID=1465811 RepID=UPI000310AA2C|nr:universal stress protein [Cellulomonas massiliensis]